MTIDPQIDPGAAVEEIEFLAERLPTPDLREAIDKLLAVGLSRAVAATSKPSGPVDDRAAQRVRFAEDFAQNVMASFRDRIAARAVP